MLIKSKHHFEILIGYSIDYIKEVLKTKDSQYYSYIQEKIKDNGSRKIRLIHPSKGELKNIQQALNKRILTKIPLTQEIYGGIRGKGNLDNCNAHKGNLYFFQTDLKACYPSINTNMVKRALRKKGIPKNICNLIAQIVTYPVSNSVRGDSLPQGTHTSTMITNIVVEPIIKKILKSLKTNDVTCTVWIDDLTFSSVHDFKEDIQMIMSTIGRYGLKPARKKTTYRKGNALITGAIVTPNSIKPTDAFRSKDMTEGRLEYRNQIYLKDKGIS